MPSTPRARPLTTQMPIGRELVRDLFRHLAPVRRGAAGADDGDRPLISCGKVAAHVDDGRRVVDFLEERRIVGIVPGQSTNAVRAEALDLYIRFDFRTLGDNCADDAVLETSGAQIAGSSRPGVSKSREAVEQRLVADAADARNAVEGGPVLELVGLGFGLGFSCGYHQAAILA